MSLVRGAWNNLQPALEKPRWFVAMALRTLLVRTKFVAVTGSNGKTTTTRYLAAILSAHQPTQCTRLNRNSTAGVTETIAFCNPLTTRFAVFEIGFKAPGSIARCARLVRPDIAIVLSVFLEHRSALKSLNNVAAEKAALLQSLPCGGVAVLNMDDPLVAGMHVPKGCKAISVGSGAKNDVWYESAESAWPGILTFTAVVFGERLNIRTRLLGMHWVVPILCCVAVARLLGVPSQTIINAIEQVTPYPGRMQVLKLPSGTTVLRDEFKGTKHTITVAFEEVRKATAGRKILVFCDMSDSPLSVKQRLSKIAQDSREIFDVVIFIGKDAHYGVAAAIKAGMAADAALAFDDYRAAGRYLISRLRTDDFLLLKANRNNQLPRLLYSLVGEVRCEVSECRLRMVCDDCPSFNNPDLVNYVNQVLTVNSSEHGRYSISPP